MKYIRTKDKVLEFIPFTGGKDGENCSYRNAKKVYKISYLDIINQADTIEELCDKYVVKLKYEEQPFVGSFYEFEHFINQYVKKIPSNNPVIDIFGAIWTDKGLIYVAKMNSKGELELL